jgi:glycosyltransferase involved in cell wall biosynthesis
MTPRHGQRPRLGVDFHTFDGLYQGSRSHLLGLYREAIAMAPEIDFVFLVGQPDRLADEHPAFRAANVQREAMPHGGGLARLGWQLAWAQRRLRLDLLHVQYRGPLLPWGPVAVTVHDTLYETHPQFFSPGFVRMARWTGRRTVRQAALVFTVSQFSRDEIARLYGLPPARIQVTGNGVDTGRFHPGAEGADAVRALGLAPGGYLLTVGRLEPRKNHLGLVRAYARLPSPRPPLVVVGQQDFGVQALFDEVQALGLQGDIRFLDRVDDGALPALLRHALAFVYPSFAEGFGMPVAEAQASGVAVLTSANSALAEVAGGAALLADPQQPADIAAQLQRLLEDAALRQRLAAAGPAQAARHAWGPAAATLVAALRRQFAVG